MKEFNRTRTRNNALHLSRPTVGNWRTFGPNSLPVGPGLRLLDLVLRLCDGLLVFPVLYLQANAQRREAHLHFGQVAHRPLLR